jgi:anti-sigma factor RsiW
MMARVNFRCRELVETVTAYFDGALSPEARAGFEAHVGHCKKCRAFVEQMRRTVEALRRLPVEGAPPATVERLRAFLRELGDGSPGATPAGG